MKKIDAHLMKSDEEFAKLGLKKRDIALWEDGLRTSGKFGEYEWWYSDIKLAGGGSLVIVYYTAPLTAMVNGFEPNITFNLNLPDGTEIKKAVKYSPADATFSKEKCDVRMKQNYIVGDLRNYSIHFEHEEIVCDVELNGTTPSWRPHTGMIDFGGKNYFAWIPSIPEAQAKIDLKIGDERLELEGTGYHDHNWGDVGMFWLMHHWYWGRAKIGPYQVISSYITAKEKFGYEHFRVFMLARDGQLLGDKGECIKYTQEEPAFDEATKKHYFKKLTYDYDDGEQHYKIVYEADDIIERMSIEDSKTMDAAKTNAFSRILMKLVGIEPAYMRFVGNASIEKIENGEVVEKHTSPALWELMYFGKDADV